MLIERPCFSAHVGYEAAGALGIALPDSAMRSATLMDGKHWDGSDPATYARSFALHAMASPAMAAL